VFIGIGSMEPGDAGRLTGLATAAGREVGMRTLIQDASAVGVPEAGPLPGDSIVIGEAPHDWLFPRMAAVIHHAGAGTAAAGLRAGVPAVGMPMVGDQPFWAARLAALGTGPRPIPYRRLSVPALAAAIREVTARPSYRERAQSIARPAGQRRRHSPGYQRAHPPGLSRYFWSGGQAQPADNTVTLAAGRAGIYRAGQGPGYGTGVRAGSSPEAAGLPGGGTLARGSSMTQPTTRTRPSLTSLRPTTTSRAGHPPSATLSARTLMTCPRALPGLTRRLRSCPA
jgi:hypothetical protein